MTQTIKIGPVSIRTLGDNFGAHPSDNAVKIHRVGIDVRKVVWLLCERTDNATAENCDLCLGIFELFWRSTKGETICQQKSCVEVAGR